MSGGPASARLGAGQSTAWPSTQATSYNRSSCSRVQTRGRVSMTHSVPTVRPPASNRGTPA